MKQSRATIAQIAVEFIEWRAMQKKKKHGIRNYYKSAIEKSVTSDVFKRELAKSPKAKIVSFDWKRT